MSKEKKTCEKLFLNSNKIIVREVHKPFQIN